MMKYFCFVIQLVNDLTLNWRD